MKSKTAVLLFAALLALASDFSQAWAQRAVSSPWAPFVQNFLKRPDLDDALSRQGKYQLFPFLKPLSSLDFNSLQGQEALESVLRKLEDKGFPDSIPNGSDAEDIVLEALQSAVAEKWSKDYTLRKSRDLIQGAARPWLKEGALGAEAGRSFPVDHNGEATRALLNDLKEAPVDSAVQLDFIPSPRSLQVIGNMNWETDIDREFEVFLYRDRATRQWGMIKGESDSVSDHGVEGDIEIHNHSFQRKGVLPYPSARDLIASAGKAARFSVISPDGLVEWSPAITFPDDPFRLLSKDPSQEERNEWLRQYSGTWKRRILAETIPSAFLRSIGVKFVLHSWSKVLKASLF